MFVYRQSTKYWGQNRNISVLLQSQVNLTPLPIFGIRPWGKFAIYSFDPVGNYRELSVFIFLRESLQIRCMRIYKYYEIKNMFQQIITYLVCSSNEMNH